MPEISLCDWFNKAPTKEEAQRVLDEDVHLLDHHITEKRKSPRTHFFVPGIFKAEKGNKLNILALDLSQFGIGILHRGHISPNQTAIITIESERRRIEYQIRLLWSLKCSNGLWRSGGKFLSQVSEASNG